MKNEKGFNFSIRAVMLVVIGVVAALAIISFLNDGTAILENFSNTTAPEGGFLGEP